MVKAALFSVALHGVIVIAMRRDRMAPRAPRTVEMVVVSRPALAVRAVASHPSMMPARMAIRTRAERSQLAETQRVERQRPETQRPETPVTAAPDKKPNLFALSAIAAGAHFDAPSGFRPRHGVGDADGRGGVAVSDFLAEDAGRERAEKGLAPPSVREMERALKGYFDPPFGHVDNANRRELLHKQFMGFLKTPPRTGELKRGVDPAKETAEEKLRSSGDHAFFLGRRVLVFARQKPDGTIVELTIRQPSGFRAFDDDALDAVEKALQARPPREGRELRTLWQLDATGYVVLAPEPTLKFDEATGKSEWIYPLQRRVDKAVRLLAVY